MLVAELLGDGAETQVAFRDGARFAPRLRRVEIATPEPKNRLLSRPRDGSYRLEIQAAGTLDRILAEPMPAYPPKDRPFLSLARGLVEEAVSERGFPW